MKERPILFSGPMIRAILDGRKTMTRRVVVPQPPDYIPDPSGRGGVVAVLGWLDWGAMFGGPGWRIGAEWGAQPWRDGPRCPYGVPGDGLWVRETWANFDDPKVVYRADCLSKDLSHEDADSAEIRKAYGVKWRPSIFMPREFSRLTLEVEAVRVERVQEITEADAMAEGIVKFADGFAYDSEGRGFHCTDPRVSFMWLWDSINEKRGYGWAVNPWVWVIQFRRLV